MYSAVFNAETAETGQPVFHPFGFRKWNYFFASNGPPCRLYTDTSAVENRNVASG